MFIKLPNGKEIRLYWRHIDISYAGTANLEAADLYKRLDAFDETLKAYGEEDGTLANRIHGLTECFIDFRDESEIIKGAVAYCSSKDAFNKEKGRKISLLHVLNDTFPNEVAGNKEIRKCVWDSYFNRFASK